MSATVCVCVLSHDLYLEICHDRASFVCSSFSHLCRALSFAASFAISNELASRLPIPAHVVWMKKHSPMETGRWMKNRSVNIHPSMSVADRCECISLRVRYASNWLNWCGSVYMHIAYARISVYMIDVHASGENETKRTTTKICRHQNNNMEQ